MSDNYNVYVNDDTEPNVSVSADSDVSALVDDDSNVVLDVEEDAGALLNADINDEELVDVPIEETIGELGADHRRLLHRDAADQHPMSAITGLTDSLTGLQNTIDSGLISVETSVSDVTLLANGKTTVYHSSTMPTGGEYKVGDTWFNSSESYCMYKWDGSNWIREQFGNGAFANASIWNATIRDGAITNAKIEDATIENGKIKDATIESAKISSLDGDKITANSLTIGKMASDVTDAITAAGATASNYITTISGLNGICVHDVNDTSNYVNLNSNGMGVFAGGTLAASFSSGGVNLYSSGTRTLGITNDAISFYDTYGANVGNIFLENVTSTYKSMSFSVVNSTTDPLYYAGLSVRTSGTNNHALVALTAQTSNASSSSLNINESEFVATAGSAYNFFKLNNGAFTSSEPYYVGSYKLLTKDTVTDSFTVNAKSYSSDTVSASKTGYKAVGVIGWSYTGTSSTYCNMYVCYMDDNEKIHYGFRNLHESNDASLSLVFYVLYVASSQGV